MAENSILEQLRHNAVAIISLVAAVSGFTYNTWRHEVSEENSNLRHAAFETLLKLGELQQVTFHAHYDRDRERGNPRTGWAYVLTIRDLSDVLSAPVQTRAQGLMDVWGEHWQGLGADQASADTIVTSIDSVRMVTVELLRSLD